MASVLFFISKSADMSKSNTLYIIIALLFAIPFLGMMLVHDAFWVYAICAIIGIILFLVRIIRGDD